MKKNVKTVLLSITIVLALILITVFAIKLHGPSYKVPRDSFIPLPPELIESRVSPIEPDRMKNGGDGG